MLFREKHVVSGKTLYRSKPLLLSAKQGYVRPAPGKTWFQTTTTVWKVDELIRRTVRDWKRLMDETGHDGERAQAFRKDHDSLYTATYSVFPAPLMEWIVLRYGGDIGGTILDSFAGGPVRGVVSSIMGHVYHGVEIRQGQIDENQGVLRKLGLDGARYHLGDARSLDIDHPAFDCAITCPPYWALEVYSDDPNDLSTCKTYEQFNAGMAFNALAQFEKLKPGAFSVVVVGNFRDKKGELTDFRSHTVQNFREANFTFHQEIILTKNFGSAAIRSGNSWKGMKLVPIHEYALVFRKPE